MGLIVGDADFISAFNIKGLVIDSVFLFQPADANRQDQRDDHVNGGDGEPDLKTHVGVRDDIAPDRRQFGHGNHADNGGAFHQMHHFAGHRG